MIISGNGPRQRLSSIYKGSWLEGVSQSPGCASCARGTECGGAETASENPCCAVNVVRTSIYYSPSTGYNDGMEPFSKTHGSIVLELP